MHVGIVIIIYCIPFIWMIWSMMDVRNGAREKINLKGPVILFAVLAVASIVVNWYLSSSYNLAFFQNSLSSIIGIVITGVLWLIIALINIFVTLTMKGAPKSIHNPKVIWIFSSVLAGALLIAFLWYFPLGQKMAYADTLDNAVNAMDDTEENQEISVVLVKSENACLRTRACDDEFNNVFYVRNNLDQPKEFQVRISAANENEEELQTIDSEIIELDPGEMKMVETEETNDNTDIWSQYSFVTEERVAYYQYNYRFRDVE